MRITDVAIRRPVLSTVMNLLIVVAGIAAYFTLPVREYPDVDRPIVSVSTAYPGASAATVESTIIEPIERVLNGIEGIRTIESTSALDMGTIQVEFESGRDIDAAATDVSNAVQRAVGELPAEAERPVVRKSGANAFPIMWLVLRGEGFSAVDLTDVADRIVRTPIQVLPGVGSVIIGGERRYAMRVWLDPSEMASNHVDALDVRKAISESNLLLPAGELEGETRKFTIQANAQLDNPAAYEDIVIRQVGDTPIRIRDVGWVELGSANYQTITRFSQKDAVGVGIIRQSRANQLDLTRRVRSALPMIREALPPGVDVTVAADSTTFVEASLREVWQTLSIAFVAVILVNLFFLRSGTATTITGISIPVALIGTFALMEIFGFSINTLTLLAFVLATGLLVDDSIVVMENIYRRQQLGESPLEAAFRGAKEVSFPVIATSISVIAVLIPLSMMTGSTGRLFREFALTLSAAIGISTFVALTIVPTTCSIFLRVTSTHRRISQEIEKVIDGVGLTFERLLGWSLGHRKVIGIFLLGTIVTIVSLFVAIPQSFVPVEDRGWIFTVIRAPQGATAAYTDRAMSKAEKHFAALPEFDRMFAAVALGLGTVPNTATAGIFTRLTDWSERSRSQQTIVSMLQQQFFGIPEAFVFPVNPPSLGQRGMNDVEVILKSSTAGLDEFTSTTDRLLKRLRGVPGLMNVDSNLRVENPELDLVFDREHAANLGIPIRSIAESIRLLVSQNPADEFVLRNRQYDVIMSLAGQQRDSPEDLLAIHVRSAGDEMIPLSALVEPRPGIGATTLNHHDLQRSVAITANLGPGAALGPMLKQVMSTVREEASGTFTVTLGGISREYVESTSMVYLTFGIALLVIYLVLAAQFESFIHPLTILLSVPLAACGALLTLWITGHTLNLYSQIGIILLVGLVTKNAILLVDFANQERARGRELLAALRLAGRIRFRPILMTSITSIFGAIPLALAFGAGAESRRPIGAAIVGGLLFSTVFTLIVIPVMHYSFIRLAERFGIRTIPPLVELTGSGEPEDGAINSGS